MGHGLGIGVVAEGVENPQTLALLRKLGCDHAQGYLIAPPVPASQAFRMANPGCELPGGVTALPGDDDRVGSAAG